MNETEASALRQWVGKGTMVRVDERPDGRFDRLVAGVWMDRPVEKVWGVIIAYEKYPEFMPQTKAVRMLKRTADVCDVSYHIDLKFSVFSTKINYSLRHRHDEENHSTRFEYLEGQLKGVSGGWTLVEADGGTLAQYELSSDLRSLGFFIKRLLKAEPLLETAIQASSALIVVNSIRRRAEM